MTGACLLAGTLLAAPLPAPETYANGAQLLQAQGLAVVVVPEPGSGRITAQWLFEAGANDDPPERFGLGHLVEHLAFGRFGGASDDYDAQLGRLGGSSEGWTDRERAGLGATVPLLDADSTDRLLALEWARRAPPALGEADLDRQRRVITQELAEALDRPHGPDRIWLDELLWAAGEPWSRHPASPPAERADAAAIAARWAELQARAVLVLGGDLRVDEVAARLGAVPDTPRARRPAPPTLGEPGCEAGAPAARHREGDVGEGALYVAWPVPGRDHPDRIALEALGRWMGGARLAVGAGCGELVVERRGGWWALGAHAASLRRAARELGERGLDAAALERVRVAQLTDLARAHGMLETRSRIAGACVLAGRAPDCLVDEVRAWQALTPEGTRRAAARWLLPDAATLLAVVPPDTLLAPPIPGMRRWGGR